MVWIESNGEIVNTNGIESPEGVFARQVTPDVNAPPAVESSQRQAYW